VCVFVRMCDADGRCELVSLQAPADDTFWRLRREGEGCGRALRERVCVCMCVCVCVVGRGGEERGRALSGEYTEHPCKEENACYLIVDQ
jgi:hypothetical protein